LKSIWLQAKEYDEMLINWKTKEFRQLNINDLNDFAQNLYKKILKMSREYKVSRIDSFVCTQMDLSRIKIGRYSSLFSIVSIHFVE